jgi:hypothetical protein
MLKYDTDCSSIFEDLQRAVQNNLEPIESSQTTRCHRDDLLPLSLLSDFIQYIDRMKCDLLRRYKIGNYRLAYRDTEKFIRRMWRQRACLV